MKQAHHIAQTRLATPLGPLTAARSARGLSGLWFDAQRHHPGPLAAPRRDDDPLFAQTATVLAAYFEGRGLPQDPTLLPFDPAGTPFQREVWNLLLRIPDGASLSYGEMAQRLGRPLAVRAVGAAVGRNPVSILIPCHRALGARGELTGYAGGLERKTALLRLEGVSFRADPRQQELLLPHLA
ncbi:methylated-DNA--[protein]-cysteine S-methyltransferase [Roseateles sp. DAIF2]|uniref:methylated-DNA--[protein]-cysteine S-methyltransferase n=1 Tax=Roseateles sp. DAIF2 TaxID=2714952 RepID=UPI0018A25C3A|nr:methylated-DNA--[protein]-cysteine S-methyltransferase [Roseateles sp. DAIF2]QPF73820.1 methylated-DNA--[protein]-cysteine S-methyltransferase [Roseateles sp. DAIF2]